MALVKQRTHDGFLVVDTMVREVLAPDGRSVAEFDGIFIATHCKHTDIDFLFVMETKQVMDMRKYKHFRQQLHKFEHEYLPLLAEAEFIKHRKSRAIAVKLNKLLQQELRASTGRVLKVEGVICSPHIPPNVMEGLKDGDRVVTTTHDQYVCSQHHSSVK